ncbi:Ca2+-binding protein, EF-hand superfamily [Actinokineospora alba]|uniref:Ca2+-binding protein, EF-hand superfamily n=1 Tax=Actinokineospora alba TaxID=504798 RepID=A0A1H0G434_9PSEU|nr:EF-hand domain-containing protein [Actinokineospora alba]TDP69753.1 Ca2+-binding EF-hand superfamily protein [Actinokineospora alba]SDI09501.1 Ca2+-binding protein, EF-hand superfamily [Actinokineospora alba]SDO01647.1 Ca2+-binding protein, EF-hand superfamily [Actinokineospora alba]
MATALQRRKISHVFTAMDTNRDGCLIESDFASIADRWVALGADRDRAEAVTSGWWATLLAASEAERVTVTEVLSVVDRLGEMTDAVVATAHTAFDAIDTNGDSAISAAEYRVLIEAWNGAPTDTDEIFPLLDLDQDGTISRDEFTAHWVEFWAGDDLDAPGTWVFGRFS